MSRPLFLLLLLALLSGCEREEQAREAERAAQTPQQSISEPVDATEAPPDLEIEVAPVNQAAEAEPPPVQIDIPEPEAPQPAARSRPAPPKQPEKPAQDAPEEDAFEEGPEEDALDHFDVDTSRPKENPADAKSNEVQLGQFGHNTFPVLIPNA